VAPSTVGKITVSTWKSSLSERKDSTPFPSRRPRKLMSKILAKISCQKWNTKSSRNEEFLERRRSFSSLMVDYTNMAISSRNGSLTVEEAEETSQDNSETS